MKLKMLLQQILRELISCKPAQLVITKFIDCESKKELLSGLQRAQYRVAFETS